MAKRRRPRRIRVQRTAADIPERTAPPHPADNPDRLPRESRRARRARESAYRAWRFPVALYKYLEAGLMTLGYKGQRLDKALEVFLPLSPPEALSRAAHQAFHLTGGARKGNRRWQREV